MLSGALALMRRLQLAQGPALATVCGEVARVEPRLERAPDQGPVVVDDGVPRAVTAPPLHDHVLSKDALEREPEALGSTARRDVEDVALPFDAPGSRGRRRRDGTSDRSPRSRQWCA